MVCGLLLMAGWAVRPCAGQGVAVGAASAPVGLEAMNDDRLISELASRGLDTLLERAFEVNQVPSDQRRALRSMADVRELLNPQSKLTSREKQELVQRITAGAGQSVAGAKDPRMLMQLAGALIKYISEREVNTLEYWGENPRTQAALRPVAETIVKALDQCAAEAQAQANKLADQFGNGPTQSQINAWKASDDLATLAAYTRQMSAYYLAMSLDRADPQRKEIAEKAIAALKQHDNIESEVQPLVRNRIAKLHMIKGDYEAAKQLFDSVANNPNGEIQPAPGISQQYEARYFGAVCDLLARNAPAAGKGLDALIAWQNTNLPKEADAGATAAATMMRYRILSLEAELAKDPAAKKQADDKALAVLLGLLKDRPEYRGIIYDQLMGRLPENPDLSKLDTLLLQALVQKGELERGKADGEAFDRPTIERAIAAAREILKRKGQSGVSAELLDAAAILIPAFLDKIDKDAEAADEYLNYIQQHPGKVRNATAALDNAMVLVSQLRKQQADVAKLLDRLLPIAINTPFDRKELAFEYAQQLQRSGRFKEAAEYYRQVPSQDKRFLHARFFEMIAIKQQLDAAEPKLDAPARQKLSAEMQKLADEVTKGAKAAVAAAGTDPERAVYRSMTARTVLLAAAMAKESDPNRTLQVLSGFEESIKGLPREDELLADALFFRVHSYMELGRNAEATESLLSLLKSKGGAQGADIIFGLLKNLDEDLDAARQNHDVPQMKKLAQARAALSSPLVEWAKANPDGKIRQYTYRYMVFDAATKQLAAEMEENPEARRAAFEGTLALYQALRSEENVQRYKETIDPARTDPSYPDPAVSLHTALVQYELGQYKAAQEALSRLLEDRKLGTARTIVERNGIEEEIDNEQYWEATHKLYRSNIALGQAALAKDPGDEAAKQMLAETRNGLKRLYIREGQGVGGKKWRDQFDELRKQLIPEFQVEGPATSATGK